MTLERPAEPAHPDFQIYTLYVNRRDLLLKAIESLGKFQQRVVVIDNSEAQDLSLETEGVEIVRPPVPLFVSQSYNLICRMAQERGQDAFFIMHSDAQASEEVVSLVLERAEALDRTRVNWGAIFTNYDVLALYHTWVVKEFPWDTYLPAYYTDVDFYYRLKIAGIRLVETGLHVEHREGGSSAMKADPAIRQWVTSNYPAWRHYYMAKWGGERDRETFVRPFDGAFP